MQSADNGSYISFVHVNPSGLTGNLNGEGEAHLKVSEKFRARLKVSKKFRARLRLIVTRRSRDKFRFIETKIVSFL